MFAYRCVLKLLCVSAPGSCGLSDRQVELDHKECKIAGETYLNLYNVCRYVRLSDAIALQGVFFLIGEFPSLATAYLRRSLSFVAAFLIRSFPPHFGTKPRPFYAFDYWVHFLREKTPLFRCLFLLSYSAPGVLGYALIY